MQPEQFLQLTDPLPEIFFLLAVDGQVLAANRAAADMLQCPQGELVGSALAGHVENTAQQVNETLAMLISQQIPTRLELTWSTGDKALTMQTEGFAIPQCTADQQDRIVLRSMITQAQQPVLQDLNAQMETQNSTLQALQKSQEALEIEHEKALVTLHSIGDAVITTNAMGELEYMNPTAEQLTGWVCDEARGQPLLSVFNIIDEETRARAENPVERCLKEGAITSMGEQTLLIARNKTEYLIEDSVAPIHNRRGEIIGTVLVFHDVTSDKLARRQLEYLAQHDILTGLFNRHYFEQQLEQAVSVARRGKRSYAMLYMDLDQFKIVNDTVGHSVGDQLLSDIARLFSQRVRQGDVLARLGGDEFGLLLNDVKRRGAKHIAEDFLSVVSGFRFNREGKSFDITTSIGIAAIDKEIVSAAEVLRHADIACYVAKHAGRNCSHMYTQQDDNEVAAVGEMRLISEIKEALEFDRFKLFYQPIIDVQTKQVVCYEVLLRMLNRDDELLTPTSFITAAEHYGLMPKIDRWVLNETFKTFTRVRGEGHDYAFTINLSGTSIGDPELLDDIKTMSSVLGTDTDRLIFEVTETAAVTHLESAEDFMREIKSLGCRFALDDFGTGFSSFAYLKHLPVDILKIDGAFICELEHDSVDQAMVRSINQIAHSLGKHTIAEFVESEATLKLLQEYGVDMAQGFHIKKPGEWSFEDSDE